MESLKELRTRRDRLSVKISDYRKKGKDTTVFEQEIAEIRNTIANYDTLVARETARAAKKASRKVKQQPVVEMPADGRWSKEALVACRKQVVDVLDSNDWRAGYQFRSSMNMYIPSVTVVTKDNAIQVRVLVQYKTKAHLVENTITKQYNPATVCDLQAFIDKMELWVMHNSGDLDVKSIVFGERFNKVQFDAQQMAAKGWVIRK